MIIIGPFAKWGIDFMICNPRSIGGHGYIIVTVDYFTKWVEVMPAYNVNDIIATQFLFNHVIACFGVHQVIVVDHGSHFHQHMMVELTNQLGLRHDSSTSYYAQDNDQFEAVNKVLITTLQHTIGKH